MIFNIKIKGKKILFVGGGSIAEFKIKKLIKESPDISVIAPEITDYIQSLGREGSINIIKKKFEINDITDEYFMVISSTDNPLINKEVSIACARLGILHDNAGDHIDSDIMMVASAIIGNLTISISTDGNDPSIAKKLKDELEEDCVSGNYNFEDDIKTIYHKKM